VNVVCDGGEMGAITLLCQLDRNLVGNKLLNSLSASPCNNSGAVGVCEAVKITTGPLPVSSNIAFIFLIIMHYPF
jgi:hypothetical protein